MLDVRKPNQPTFYQLYVNKDRSASERILKKIEERGCTAVMLTVDAPVMGKREADMRAKGEVVETGGGHGGDSTTSGGGVASAISGYIDPNLVSPAVLARSKLLLLLLLADEFFIHHHRAGTTLHGIGAHAPCHSFSRAYKASPTSRKPPSVASRASCCPITEVARWTFHQHQSMS